VKERKYKQPDYRQMSCNPTIHTFMNVDIFHSQEALHAKAISFYQAVLLFYVTEKRHIAPTMLVVVFLIQQKEIYRQYYWRVLSFRTMRTASNKYSLLRKTARTGRHICLSIHPDCSYRTTQMFINSPDSMGILQQTKQLAYTYNIRSSVKKCYQDINRHGEFTVCDSITRGEIQDASDV
jgi:hypothetical protein